MLVSQVQSLEPFWIYCESAGFIGCLQVHSSSRAVTVQVIPHSGSIMYSFNLSVEIFTDSEVILYLIVCSLYINRHGPGGTHSQYAWDCVSYQQ